MLELNNYDISIATLCAGVIVDWHVSTLCRWCIMTIVHNGMEIKY